MEFNRLFKRISPRLKTIARSRNGHGLYINEEDLYQEMCMHLWNKYGDGIPADINDAYIIRGCEFHILNYLRKTRERVTTLSLERPVDEEGNTLKDILPSPDESLDRRIDKDIAIQHIKNNGFTKREKEVFSLLLKGYTVREAGKRLGISHVMVVKFKKRIIEKWQGNRRYRGYQKQRIFTLDS